MKIHRGMIGPLGPPGRCPKCGSYSIDWGAASDVSHCKDCKWGNEAESDANFEKRRMNGEIL